MLTLRSASRGRIPALPLVHHRLLSTSYQPKRTAKVHRVWAFGDGQEGALGNGDKSDASTPTQVLDLDEKTFSSISSGWSFNLAVTADHQLYSWGRAGSHLALPSHRGNCYVPQHSDVSSPLQLTQVAAGRVHSVGLSANGDVFAWGNSQFGQTGSGSDTEEKWFPYRIDALRGLGITSISAGLDHACALSECGRVWTWGFNECGQLGLGTLDDLMESDIVDMAKEDEDEAPFVGTPSEIDTEGVRVTSATCGHDCTAFVSEDGELYTCGNGEHGALGHPEPIDHIPFPTRVAGISGVQRVSVGGTHMAALTSDGQVYTWGWGQCGQLGHGDDQQKVLEPRAIPFFNGKNISNVVCGGGHTMCISEEENRLYAFGFGGMGRLGTRSTNDEFEPVAVEFFDDMKISFVSCSLDHTIVITEHEKTLM